MRRLASPRRASSLYRPKVGSSPARGGTPTRTPDRASTPPKVNATASPRNVATSNAERREDASANTSSRGGNEATTNDSALPNPSSLLSKLRSKAQGEDRGTPSKSEATEGESTQTTPSKPSLLAKLRKDRPAEITPVQNGNHRATEDKSPDPHPTSSGEADVAPASASNGNSVLARLRARQAAEKRPVEENGANGATPPPRQDEAAQDQQPTEAAQSTPMGSSRLAMMRRERKMQQQQQRQQEEEPTETAEW